MSKKIKIQLNYSCEYDLENLSHVLAEGVTLDELVEQLELEFAEHIDHFIILDNLETTITESEGN